MSRDYKRAATIDELKALAHPIRVRILRMCYGAPKTNQELATQLGLAPGTVLRHVKILLDSGLLVPEETRPGPRGVTERPYRATGLTWHLSLETGEPELTKRVELAALEAYRDELVASGPGTTLSRVRIELRLPADEQRELAARIKSLIEDYRQRETPDGDLVNIFWSMHLQAGD